MLNKAGWLVVGILVGGCSVRACAALRHSISPQGEGWILLAALVAMVAGAAMVFFDVRS